MQKRNVIVLWGIVLLVVISLFVNVVAVKQINKQRQKQVYVSIVVDIVLQKLHSTLIAEYISDIWSYAIDNQLDFNEILNAAFQRKFMIDSIQYNMLHKKQIDAAIQNLKNDADEYQAMYNALVDLCLVYTQIYSFSVSPSGSLVTYNEKLNDLKLEFDKDLNRVNLYLPVGEEVKKALLLAEKEELYDKVEELEKEKKEFRKEVKQLIEAEIVTEQFKNRTKRFIVEGCIVYQEEPAVLIDGIIYQLNSSVGGGEITVISERSITIEFDDKTTRVYYVGQYLED